MTDHIEAAAPKVIIPIGGRATVTFGRRMKEPTKDTLRYRAELAEAEAAFYMAAADEAVPISTVRWLVAAAVLIGLLIGRALL